MKSVIHVNDKITIAGGVEVYVSQIQPLLRELGWRSEWVGMSRSRQRLKIESDNKKFRWDGLLRDFSSSPVAEFMREGLVHLHSISDPVLIRALLAISPVVRTMHEPRMFCPGQGKFWAKTEQICSRPMGLHCLAHAYTQHCCNRRPDRVLKQFLNSRFEITYAAKRYFKLLANSTYTQGEALKVGICASRVELLHNFTPTTAAPIWTETSGSRLLYIGRLSQTKGVHYLLCAFKLVLAKNRSVVLDLMGSGHDEPLFRNQAETLGIADSVNFLGWGDRAEVDQAIAGCDLVLFPSIYPEAFGIVGIEAMMRGRPVVGFDVGGVKDWLWHEETGLLVAVKETQALADSVIRILDDDDLRLQMGRRAREVALAEFSEEVHIQKLVGIYNDAGILGSFDKEP